MFAKESGTKVESMFAWIDEACIDQGTWAKYPDIGMSFVYGAWYPSNTGSAPKLLRTLKPITTWLYGRRAPLRIDNFSN